VYTGGGLAPVAVALPGGIAALPAGILFVRRAVWPREHAYAENGQVPGALAVHDHLSNAQYNQERALEGVFAS